MGLTRLALTRPIFIFMLVFGAIFMGYRAFNSMRVELQPEVTFGAVTISTVYPGAGPDEVNELISRRIEEAVSGISGVKEITSTSLEGVSTAVVNFELGTNMDEALNEVRSKVDLAVPQLPEGVEKPTIGKFDFSSAPVLVMTLRSETLSNQQLRDLADDRLQDSFAEIPGVAAVGISGGDVREIQIQIRKDKLLAYGIGVAEIQRAVAASTLNVPSGRIVTPTSEQRVRVLGQFQTVAEIENMVLSLQDNTTPGAKPRVVRLRDIADIEDTTEERRQVSRLNGTDAVSMTLQKTRDGNAVEISEGAHEVIEEIEGRYPVEFVVSNDTSIQIEESLFDLGFALFFGIFLVAMVVYVFLHNFRGMLIVSIAIPICLMATFIVLWGLGFTINNMSMLALSLAVGVLVDDAIVVLENIYRHLKMGESPRDAAINGRSEIGLAAIAITLADVVVFLPIAFMGGIVGQFFKPLAVGFAVAVIMSLFVSFTVTPLLASRWYRAGEDVEHPNGRFANWFERNWARFAAFYGRLLEWSLKHRWFVFLSGFVALLSVFVMLGGSMGAGEMMARTLTMLAVVIAFIALGINYWTQVLPQRARRIGVIAAIAVGFVLAAVPAVPLPPVIGGVFVMFFLYGLAAFFANLANTKVKSRIILGALAFGGFFFFASWAGSTIAAWKQGPLFGFQFMPESDPGSVMISVETAPGTSLASTLAVVKQVEAVAGKHPDAKYVTSTVGSQSGGFGGGGNTGSNYAQIRVSLHDKMALLDRIMFWKEHEEQLRTASSSSVAADLLEQIGRVPGADVKVAASEGMGFGSPIQMSFRGDDPALLVATTQKIKERLQAGAVKGVINPDISSKPGNPEVRVIPDRVMLADVGRTPADVATAMRLLYEGDDSTVFRVGGREYKIRVMMAREDRDNPDILSQLPLAFVQGNPIFLSQVAQIQRGTGLNKIERRDRQEEVRLTADLLPGTPAGNVQAEIDQLIESENLLPQGVTIAPLGQAQAQAEEGQYLFAALGMGLLLVYMLLASLYDNLLYPFIIQLAQPQAMVGALLALMITDKSLNIVGMIGIITLVGLVGKNAILLVDYTNTLRGRGRTRHDALVEAGPVRLRPIMMTSMAVVLGMLPVALAIGRGSEFRETIGITIIGGIILSTILTLLIIPCSYTIFDDFSNWLSRVFKRGGSQPPTEAPNLFDDPDLKSEPTPARVV